MASILIQKKTHRYAFKSQLPQTTESIENKENGKRASQTWDQCRCRKKMSIQNMCNSNSKWFCIFWYSHLSLIEHLCGKREKVFCLVKIESVIKNSFIKNFERNSASIFHHRHRTRVSFWLAVEECLGPHWNWLLIHMKWFIRVTCGE